MLIDSLVVCVLLLVLALLLLPALFAARERARRAACANNMNQMGMATEMYLGLFGNYYPGGLDWRYDYPAPNRYVEDAKTPSLTRMHWYRAENLKTGRPEWAIVVDGDPKDAASDLTGNPSLWDPSLIATGHVGFKANWRPQDKETLKAAPCSILCRLAARRRHSSDRPARGPSDADPRDPPGAARRRGVHRAEVPGTLRDGGR